VNVEEFQVIALPNAAEPPRQKVSDFPITMFNTALSLWHLTFRRYYLSGTIKTQ